MGGIRTPIEIESSLTWNRLVRQTFQAIPTPESWGTRWGFQIPPVSYQAQGFVYLIGVGSESASPTWRLGCSARLASGAVPDSAGEFNSELGLPLRVGDRRPCTLGSYTLCIWPDMEMADPRLIIEFPHWLQDATIEIFWYDGEYSGDFFKKLRESLAEIFGDEAYVDSTLGRYINSRVQQGIAGHAANENAHSQYLKKYEAADQYLRISDLDVAIADSDALRIALDAYLLKTEANAAFVKQETFDQERLFTDQAIQEAKDIAAADLAAHLGATNPHGITPEAIGAAPVYHTHEEIASQGNLQINSLQIIEPLAIAFGGSGGSTPSQALANLGGAPLTHTHSLDLSTTNGVLPILKGGTNATTAYQARINLGITPEAIGAAPVYHTHGNSDPSEFAFRSGWSSYQAPSSAHWIQNDSRIVILRGAVVRSVAVSSNVVIARLPAGCRPYQKVVSICWAVFNNSYQVVRVDVEEDGDIVLNYPTVTTAISWLSLDNIVFPVL